MLFDLRSNTLFRLTCNKKVPLYVYVNRDITKTINKMKKIGTLLGLTAIMLLAACDPDDYQHPDVLVGNWVSVSNTKDPALNLYFDGENVTVKNGSRNYRPFTSDIEWSYYMTKDSVLCIQHTEYYGDGDYTTNYEELELSFRDSYSTMTLRYEPSFSTAREYTLIKR